MHISVLNVYMYTGGPLSLRQQCMIKIRGAFLSGVIDKLPLPDMMKKEIKIIPQVHCEYQQVDRESKYDNLQSSDSEIDPLGQSKALVAEGTISKLELRCNVDPENSSTADVLDVDSRTDHEIVISQTPSSIQSSPVRHKVAKKEIQVY